MGFQRTDLDNAWAFVRGPARLLMADIDQDFPSAISEVIVLDPDSDQNIFDAQDGWTDLGATKGGLQINIQRGDEQHSIDPNTGDVNVDPNSWGANLTTNLAEVTLEHIQTVWEAGEITINDSGERVINYGQALRLTPRRFAVLYMNDATGAIRIHVFRRVVLDSQESGITYAKTGDQQTIPFHLRAMPDHTEYDPKAKLFRIIEQVVPADVSDIFTDDLGNRFIETIPTGPAGGVLSGNYPNPGFSTEVQDTLDIVDSLDTRISDNESELATHDSEISSNTTELADHESRLDVVEGTYISKAIADAKADLIVGTANDTVARKAVGSDGQALVADSSVGADGLRWLSMFTSGSHASRIGATHRPGRLWKETDTNLVYLDDTGGTWTLWKAEGHVRKTSDETVNNSNTLQNDDHLFIPVEANEIWIFEFKCFVSTVTTTPHWLAGVYGPAGAAVNMFANTNDFNTALAASLISNTFNFPTVAGVTAGRIWGRLSVGATAGNFGLRWAQNTATAEDTKVLINSMLIVRRIA